MPLSSSAISAHLMKFYNPLDLDTQFSDGKLAVAKVNGNLTFLHHSSRGLLAVSVQGLVGHFIVHPEFYSAVPHNTFMSKGVHPSVCIEDFLVDLELIREDERYLIIEESEAYEVAIQALERQKRITEAAPYTVELRGVLL